ncbi:SDR family NAD(P)-dependent oxidoreductase [Streptomyces griseorubiginosus]|uniref:SDR family NAD(P)-dependent oxidoreductase n=1 Tax=Streptomyces griseorubiginosus TaxID=67304 RepID=UPI003401567E
MTVDFANKAAFVTGASSGIGRVTALAFARAGASVTAVDIDEEGAVETVRQIEKEGERAIAFTRDMTSEAAVEAAVEATLHNFGRLDAAFNNAGSSSRSHPWPRLARPTSTG